MCDILQTVKEQLTDIENDYDNLQSNSYGAAEPTLLNMPVEIILKICSFLDADFLKYTFGKVCTRFAVILADDHIWKHRIHSMIKGHFPVLPQLKIWDEMFVDWQAISVEMDVEKKKWSNTNDSMKHIVVKDVHFASVDTVLLINNGELCISGGRDRSMALWNIRDIQAQAADDGPTLTTSTKPRHIRHDAHAGWVWDLAPDHVDNASMIYSASWDNTVKAWDLNTEFSCIETFKCGMSALSVVTCEGTVLAGLYSKKVLCFDVRAGAEPRYAYKAHKGPVLSLAAHRGRGAAVSEDKTRAVWAAAAAKLLAANVKIPIDKAYPVCVSWNDAAMYVGDSKGCLHLMNPETFSFVKTHEIWPEPPVTKPCSKITSCHQSYGNLIVCSDRGEIKFFYNSYPPYEYAAVRTSTYDVTQVRYLRGVLAAGTCDSALEFWLPRAASAAHHL